MITCRGKITRLLRAGRDELNGMLLAGEALKLKQEGGAREAGRA